MKIIFRCDPALVDHLPRPMPARLALPDWLRDMPREAASEAHGEAVRTVKQCPPFVDAMAHGFVIPLPCDITVNHGVLSWDWDIPVLANESHPRAPISFHVPAQLAGTPFHAPDQMIVKFNCFWTIELEAGWSLFALHPANRTDLPFRTLNGLVEADRFVDVPILFPAQWTDPGFSGVLKRGTPFVQCLAVPRAAPDLAFAPMDAAALQRFGALATDLLSGPGVYRKRFRQGASAPLQELPQPVEGEE